MKKFLCYIALLVLVIIIATPPLLRVFYKDKEEEVVVDEYAMLSCAKDDYGITSSYKNNEPLNIRFKHLVDDPNLEQNSDDYALEYLLHLTLRDAPTSNKEEGTTTVNETEVKTISYTLVYANSTNDVLGELTDYRLNLEEQKTYYENHGYTCNIIEG